MSTPSDPAPTVVVGLDSDPCTDHTLSVAADMARRLGARLHVVHVSGIADYPPDSDAPDWERQGEVAVAELRQRVARTLASTGVGWSFEACRGDPAIELVRAATKQDSPFTVVGTHRHGIRAMLSHLAHPSVSKGVIRHQDRPVLVVPSPRPAHQPRSPRKTARAPQPSELASL